ncbi:hypothetical protein SDC9_176918 [bioreactor metagenome]|uniref:Uncharacterized protein n=1 Tax=bioreactor metagenome TaxID=1076179 RepID=A0A645GRU8_9ZZZZ
MPPHQGIPWQCIAAGCPPLPGWSLNRAGLHQLGDADGHGAHRPGRLVGSLGDDHQGVLCSQHGIEQPLAAHRPTISGPVGGAPARSTKQIVAVETGRPRKMRVVEAQNTDHPGLDAGQIVEVGHQQRAVAVVGAATGRVAPRIQPAGDVADIE